MIGATLVFGVTQAGVEERSGEQRISHRVLRRNFVLFSGLDQPLDFGIVVVLYRSAWKPGMVPAPQVPFVVGDLDLAAVTGLIENTDIIGEGLFRPFGMHDAYQIVGDIVLSS